MFILQLVMVTIAGGLAAHWRLYGWRYLIVFLLVYCAGIIMGLQV